MGRRLARELALKILYSYETGNKELAKIMHNILETKRYSIADKEFTKKMVLGTINNLTQIDMQIAQALENWQYERLSIIDKIIIRLGTWELLCCPEIPYRVSINEAIEVSKKYGGEDSPRFINGVLDALANLFRKKSEGRCESSNNQ